MKRALHARLFVPQGLISDAVHRRAVDALLGAGFLTRWEPYGEGASYYGLEHGTYSGRDPDEAMGAFHGSAAWAMSLFKPSRGSMHPAEVLLGIYRSTPRRGEGLDMISASVDVPFSRLSTYHTRSFLAWSMLLASVTQPVYGWGGCDYSEGEDPTTDQVAESLRSEGTPALGWLTVYGAPFADRLGRDRLLGAPAWRADLLANDAIALVLGPNVDDVSPDAAAALASYLDVPTTSGPE